MKKKIYRVASFSDGNENWEIVAESYCEALEKALEDLNYGIAEAGT